MAKKNEVNYFRPKVDKVNGTTIFNKNKEAQLSLSRGDTLYSNVFNVTYPWMRKWFEYYNKQVFDERGKIFKKRYDSMYQTPSYDNIKFTSQILPLGVPIREDSDVYVSSYPYLNVSEGSFKFQITKYIYQFGNTLKLNGDLEKIAFLYNSMNYKYEEILRNFIKTKRNVLILLLKDLPNGATIWNNILIEFIRLNPYIVSYINYLIDTNNFIEEINVERVSPFYHLFSQKYSLFPTNSSSYNWDENNEWIRKYFDKDSKGFYKFKDGVDTYFLDCQSLLKGASNFLGVLTNAIKNMTNNTLIFSFSNITITMNKRDFANIDRERSSNQMFLKYREKEVTWNKVVSGSTVTLTYKDPSLSLAEFDLCFRNENVVDIAHLMFEFPNEALKPLKYDVLEYGTVEASNEIGIKITTTTTKESTKVIELYEYYWGGIDE